jgi:hypothetical protein
MLKSLHSFRGGNVSTFKDRLRMILPFLAIVIAAVALSRLVAPGNATWAAALPWALLALFWVYLAVMIRRERRRGSAG